MKMDMLNKRVKFKWYMVLSFFAFLTSCQAQEDDYLKSYGRDFNTQRLKWSIPLIEEDWVLKYSDSTHMYWTDSDDVVSTIYPIHLLKRINLDKGKLVSEEDEFHYKTATDKSYRVVSVYSFETKRFDGRFITYFKGRIPPSESKPLTMFQVDSILVEWGLKK